MLHFKFFRNILPLVLQSRRGYCLTQSILNAPCLRAQEQICFLLQWPQLTQYRGFKDKDVLTKRCRDCYFQRVDGRWYVFCRTHPRHKQRQKVDEKSKWIITHSTHGRIKF